MGEIKVTAEHGGRPITLDPIRVLDVVVEVREVESTIPAGFQLNWGEGEGDGHTIEATSGAGVGSRWGTFIIDERRYVYDIKQFVEALIAKIE